MKLEVEYKDSRKIDRFELDPSKSKWVIGRSQSADVCIPRDELSRAHFELERIDQDFFITDLNSTNGIYVNGEKIPTSERTLFKNIFPIEIGETISIVIITESTENLVEPNEIKHEHRTGKRIIERKANFSGNTKKVLKEESSKKGTNILLVLSVVIISLGILYYKFKEDSVQTEIVQSNNLPIEQAKRKELIISQVSSTVLETLSKKSDCSKLESLCKDLNLIRLGEGIAFDQNEAYVFVNAYEQIPKDAHSGFSNLKDEEQIEFILARFILRPEILMLAQEKGIKKIIAVAFSDIEGIILFKYISQVEVSLVKELTKDVYDQIFSEIFYGGIFRPFRQGIGQNLSFQKI